MDRENLMQFNSKSRKNIAGVLAIISGIAYLFSAIIVFRPLADTLFDSYKYFSYVRPSAVLLYNSLIALSLIYFGLVLFSGKASKKLLMPAAVVILISIFYLYMSSAFYIKMLVQSIQSGFEGVPSAISFFALILLIMTKIFINLYLTITLTSVVGGYTKAFKAMRIFSTALIIVNVLILVAAFLVLEVVLILVSFFGGIFGSMPVMDSFNMYAVYLITNFLAVTLYALFARSFTKSVSTK
jgi:hypothetical protein